METIQVVIDARLLRAADRAARRANLSRSALIRIALSEHLRRLEIEQLEEQDCRGYQLRPQKSEEWTGWERAAVWPGRW